MDQFCYTQPHPAITTDIVVFTVQNQKMHVLLVKRIYEPFAGRLALPGGFIEIDEDLEEAAVRELQAKTGVSGVYLEQLYTFGRKDRDPRERVITVAYFALLAPNKVQVQAGEGTAEVGWFPVNDLPELAFDHNDVINTARARLASKSKYSTVALQLLPTEFTLTELQQVYEILLQDNLDKRNFRKWILSLDCIYETGELRRSGQHRPAKLFRAKNPNTVEFFR